MRYSARMFVLVLACTLATGVAVSQETTGEIKGYVTSDDGATLPGVMVTVLSTDTGLKRGTVSDARGSFQFPHLPPAKYELSAVLDGFQTYTRNVDVDLGRTVTVSFVMQIGAVTEVIEVTAEAPLVDVTSSVTGITVSTDDLNAKMPIGREATQVALLAPATTQGDSAFDGGTRGRTPGQNLASLGGASVAENSYQVNGLNITNFRNGLGSTMVPFEFVEEMQIKTGGYEAEFGRSTGGIINMVTKSGSNAFHGTLNGYFYPESLQEQEPDVYFADNQNEKEESIEGNASISGPIWRDKLFFFAFVRYTDDFDTIIDADEDGAPGSGQVEQRINTAPYWGGKIDWNITPSHRLEGTFISDAVEVEQTVYEYDRTGGTGRGDVIGEGTLNRGGDNYIGKYTGIFGQNFLLSAQYGFNQFDRTDSSTVDQNPAVYDHRSGSYIPIGAWVNWNYGVGLDEREAYRVDMDWYLGNHSLRGGADYEDGYSLDETRNSGDVYFLYDVASNHRTYVGNDLPDDELIVRRRVYSTGGEYSTQSNALYLQDTWAVTPSLTLNIGLRYEEFINKNGIGERFIDIKDQYAPRVGAIWDISGQGRSKLYASYGRYFLPVAANTNIRMAGNEIYEHSYYLWDGTWEPVTNAPTNFDWYTCVVGQPQSCANQGAVGDLVGYNMISDGVVPDWRETLSSNLEPMSQDEIILGYEQMVGNNWSVGIRGVARQFGQVIEDYTIDAGLGALGVACFDPDDPSFGTCASEYRMGNPGSDFEGYYDLDGDGELDEVFISAEDNDYPEATREYYAVELTFTKRYSNNWMLQGSYTWSHLYGNYEGYVNSEIGQDDAGITQSFDYAGLMDFASGDLPQDRRHNLKVFGSYAFNFGLQLGGNFYYRSGRPINSLGYHPTDDHAAQYGAFSFYTDGEPTPRGSLGTTDNIWGLDGMIKYDVQLGRGTILDFRLDVFNMFNNDGYTEIREIAESGGVGQPDTNFLRHTRYQMPRQVRFGVGIRF